MGIQSDTVQTSSNFNSSLILFSLCYSPLLSFCHYCLHLPLKICFLILWLQRLWRDGGKMIGGDSLICWLMHYWSQAPIRVKSEGLCVWSHTGATAPERVSPSHVFIHAHTGFVYPFIYLFQWKSWYIVIIIFICVSTVELFQSSYVVHVDLPRLYKDFKC